MEYQIKEDGRFQFLETGEGPILLVLHGLFGALSNFKDVIEHFKNDYTVVVPLLPLYTMPPEDTSVGALAIFARDFIKHRNYKNVTLLGNSLGGHVALICAASYPDNIANLVLTGSSGLYEEAFGEGYPRKGDKEYLRRKIEITFYDPAMTTDELVDECHEIINNREKALRILYLSKSAIRHNMADDLPSIKLPTCLIWGRDDKITPPKVAEEFNTMMPNSELFWIDKCGHAAMMERPQEFNSVLEGWLKNLS
ncbi:MAG: alpha/beta hydrolase [Bacteroidetes bacterium]|nr:MAG: alpha/beta hydrolase [Bacteroidota bacterium]